MKVWRPDVYEMSLSGEEMHLLLLALQYAHDNGQDAINVDMAGRKDREAHEAAKTILSELKQVTF